VRELAAVRDSIDETLALIKQGRNQEAYTQARAGYLDHYELVEVPLRLVAPDLTADTETEFARIRGLLKVGAPVEQVRDRIVELRRMIDDGERRLTDVGFGAASVVAGQSFLIIFREGIEAVLLLTALLGYLETAKTPGYRKPIMWGMGLAVVATGVTFVLLRAVLAALPVGREVLEAVTAFAAVAVLLYISFWLVTRLENRRWQEFLRGRLFSAVSLGSTVALVLVGFTALYREGFETALLYQALAEFAQGLGVWVVVGLVAGLLALAVVSFAIFRLGRALPVTAFLAGAVVLLMATSVAILGNAVRALQSADVVGLTPLDGWPTAPIFLAQAFGYWPSTQTIAAQAALVVVYLLGAAWLFLLSPRRRRAPQPVAGTDRA
jgi:high-affinity iron transporter